MSRDNDPVVLISYAGYMESQPETSSELSRSYAVVKLGSMAGSFQVQQLYLLSYRQVRHAHIQVRTLAVR